MEYAQEGDLKQLIATYKSKNTPNNEKTIILYFSQIITAIQYLHNVKKIIHRDIKPENFFQHHYPFDFGIAKELSREEFAQTPYYLSPEIYNGLKYDYKIDIWTLGCLLYELCT